MGVIPAPALMLIDQMADGFLVEITAAGGALGYNRFFQEIPQLMAQPRAYRDSEPHLAASQVLSRDKAPKRLFQQVLGCQMSQFVAGRQRRRKFHQVVI